MADLTQPTIHDDEELDELASAILAFHAAGNTNPPSLADLRPYRRLSWVALVLLVAAGAASLVLTSTTLFWNSDTPLPAIFLISVTVPLWVGGFAAAGRLTTSAGILAGLGAVLLGLVPMYIGAHGGANVWPLASSIGALIGLVLLGLAWNLTRRLPWLSYVALFPFFLAALLVEALKLAVVASAFGIWGSEGSFASLSDPGLVPAVPLGYVAALILQVVTFVGGLMLASRVGKRSPEIDSSDQVGPLNQVAVLALVLGIVGIGVGAIAAGYLARQQLRSRGGRGEGYALAAILIGFSELAFSLIVLGVALSTWINALS